jgi:hypothetical protein
MKTIPAIVKTIFAGILTTAAVITLGVTLVEAYKDAKEERQLIIEGNAGVKEKLELVIKDVQDIKGWQSTMSQDMSNMRKSDQNLKEYMMSTAARRGDVRELMDVIKIWEDEKKKLESSIEQTPLLPIVLIH